MLRTPPHSHTFNTVEFNVQKNRISFRGFIICIKFDRGGNPCLRRFKLHCIDYNWRHCSNIKILAHEKKNTHAWKIMGHPYTVYSYDKRLYQTISQKRPYTCEFMEKY